MGSTKPGLSEKTENKGQNEMKNYSIPLLIGVIGALSLVVFGILTEETILFAFALAVLALGFGTGGLMIALHTDKKINAINDSIENIKVLQVEMNKSIQEQQQSPSRPILATLEGLSQYYLDYMKKQKENQGENNEKS